MHNISTSEIPFDLGACVRLEHYDIVKEMPFRVLTFFENMIGLRNVPEYSVDLTESRNPCLESHRAIYEGNLDPTSFHIPLHYVI